MRVAEHRIAREFGLADRDQLAADASPVDAGRGQPPGLQERRDQQHAVTPGAEHLPADRLQRPHLRHHMAAQRGVAAADQLDPRPPPCRHGDQPARGQHGPLHRIRLSQAARIGQHETDRGRIERSSVGILARSPPGRRAPPATRSGHHPARPAPARPPQASRGSTRPQAIIIGDSRGQPREHPRCGRQAVPRQPGPLPSARAQIPSTVLPPPDMPDRVSWPAAVPAPTSPCAGEHPHQAQRSQDDDRHVHRGDPADLVALHDVGA